MVEGSTVFIYAYGCSLAVQMGVYTPVSPRHSCSPRKLPEIMFPRISYVKKLDLALSFISLAMLAFPVSGGTLYSNGPLNGTGNSIAISGGYATSDSFTVSGASTVTSFDFAVWNFSFDTTTNIDWSIGTSIGGSQNGAGTDTPITGVLDLTNGPWDVYTYTISGLNVALPGSGTYFLTLKNAIVTNGDPAYWDENDGPSAAYQDFDSGSFYSLANNDTAPGGVCGNGQVDCTGSETFDINGNTSGAPEPASILLAGVGGMLAVMLRRKSAV